MRSEMKKQGYDLRYDAKHNFNTAIAAIRRLKQDVDKTQFSTQENFGNDSANTEAGWMKGAGKTDV